MPTISHRHRFIFIRPRKVAGTSVTIALSSSLGSEDILVLDGELSYIPDLDAEHFDTVKPRNRNALFADKGSYIHVLPQLVRKKLGTASWDSYLKFTVVRNPWDWFASYYQWKLFYDWPSVIANRHRRRDLRNLKRAKDLLLESAVKESVEFALRRRLFEKHIAQMQQFYFIKGKKYADCYLRFENLQADYDLLCERLQIETKPLPRTKSGIRRHHAYQTMYSDYAQSYIGKRCRLVTQAFDYRFD